MDDQRAGEGTADAVDPPLPPPAPERPPGPPIPGQAPDPWQPPRQPVPIPSSTYRPYVAPPRLEIGALVGRTFDTFGREWSLFLALAIPDALAAFIVAFLTPSMQASLRAGVTRTPADQLGDAALSLSVSVLSLISSLAIIIAADSFWRGTPIGLGETMARTARRIPRAIGVFLLFGLVVILVSIGLAFVLVASSLLGPLAALLVVVLAFAAVIAAIVLVVRMVPLYAVIALEDVPVRKVIGRSWALTRGNVLPLIGLAIVIGFSTILPTWGSFTFNLFVEDRLIAGIAAGLGALVVAPVSTIWMVLAWAVLSGAPYRDTEVMTTGKGRSLGFLFVAGVGLLLLMTGATVAAAGSEEFLRLVGAQ